MDYRDRIVVDPSIRFSKAVVKGSRISVSDILGHLAAGDSKEEILEAFPQLTLDDILACFGYLADRDGIMRITYGPKR